MIKTINLGNKKESLKALSFIQTKLLIGHDIRINNSHITELNKVIGEQVFRKDAVYISYQTLWEVMQPIGKKNKHHFHGLTPLNVFEALGTMHCSEDVTLSYDNRYVVVTLATVLEDVFLAVVITAGGAKDNKNVTRIITIYPVKK